MLPRRNFPSLFKPMQLAKPSNSLFSKKRIELIRKHLLGGKYIYKTILCMECILLSYLYFYYSYMHDEIFSIHAESDDDITTRLRQFVREKQFELQNFSTYGLENVLVVPRRKNNQVQSIHKIVLAILEHILQVS